MSFNFKPLFEQYKCILIGEIYGTREMPAILISCIKQALDSLTSISLVLEVPLELTPVLDSAIRHGRSEYSHEWFKRAQEWGGWTPALAKTLKEISAHKQSSKLRVRGIDALKFNESQEREEVMTENFLSLINTELSGTFIFYGGNFHAQTEEHGRPMNLPIPMGKRLVKREVNCCSIYLSSTGGKAHCGIIGPTGETIPPPNPVGNSSIKASAGEGPVLIDDEPWTFEINVGSVTPSGGEAS